jgi:hypothetical protein
MLKQFSCQFTVLGFENKIFTENREPRTEN